MASPMIPQDLRARYNVQMRIDALDRTTAAYVPVSEAGVADVWFDMNGYSKVLLLFLLATRADNIEEAKVFAAVDSINSTSDAVEVGDYEDLATDILTHDAAGDWVAVEVTEQQLAQEGADAGLALRYVAAKVKLGNASDRVTVIIMAESKRPHKDLTLDYIG